MGGIKNREAKRAANSVVTSVGKGSAAEAQKFLEERAARNQLACPYCDRVFKEALKRNHHVKQKHADEAASSADAGAPATSGSLGPAGATKPAPSATTDEKSKQKQPRVMDIGSKAGAYDYKSPRLLLLELLQRSKAPKARFKPIFDESTSAWRCKVVLPDAKKKEDDVVLFLDRGDACADEQEAQQRAAVLALHHLAGNRSLERTLPPSYVGMWMAVGEKSKVREERARRAAEREQREKESKVRAIKKELSGQGPVQITMTDEHRAAIEGILHEVKKNDACGSSAPQRHANEVDELATELEVLGFVQEDAATAAAACSGLSSALDWLCLNIPEDRLPREFAAGAAGKPVTVIRRKDGATGSRTEASGDADVVDPAVSELERYGYSRSEAMEALASHRGDVLSSAVALFLSMCASAGLAESFGSEGDYASGKLPTGDLVEEELMALEAIFGDAVSMDGNVATVRIVDGDDCNGDRTSPSTVVRFVLPPSYPDTCPVVTVECAANSASGRQIKHLMTSTVLPALVGARGAPVVYDIASLVGESIADLPNDVDDESASGDGQGQDESQDENGEEDDVLDHRVVEPRRQESSKRRIQAALSPVQMRHENDRLSSQQLKLETDPSHSRIRKQRHGLPAASMRDEVVQAINRNTVTIIMGSTGCGKSTQVPQFILEHAISESRGGECNIICTQPRRISAIGLATRVAQERAESVGSTIGYSVRLDSKQSSQTRLLFCTTGVMLRRLLGDPELCSVTHIVLDEVHERTIEGDLLLFLLRELLLSGKNRTIKVVLMSATAEAGLFAGYFSKLAGTKGALPPVISIPGFTHPVQDFFLEDALECTGYLVGKSSKWAKKNVKNEAAVVERYKGAGYSEATARSMAVIDESTINVDLIEALVCSVLKSNQTNTSLSKGNMPSRSNNNAILIFVPGAFLINKLVKSLSSSAVIRSGGFEVMALPLHGGLPPSQQSKVFDRPPPGVTKIVVATNVAETSITIDDVTCVIDSGKANEVRFDGVKGISRLQEVFVSQASCQQRRGRAGRVQPGVCYRLFSKKTWEKMDKNTLPEISRSALHSLVMDTKAIVGGDVHEVLDNMLTPPPKDGLRRAVQSLELMGALDAQSQMLTPLGKHLTQMPCDPKLGKMLIYGAILRCVDPVLTIVAAQAFGKSVFWSTQDTRQEADAMRSQLVSSMTGESSSSSTSTKSDHIATIAAFNGWRRAVQKSGRKEGSRYCTEYFVSEQAMEAIRQGRRQFAQILADLGFISHAYVSTVDRPSLAEDGQPANGAYGEPDEYAGHARVVKAALASGFYPQLLRVENPAAKFQKVDGGAFETEGPGGKVKLFDRERGRVFIHPSSINFSVGKFESGWLVYSDIMETTKVFIRECSMVPVYAVLLFAGSVAVQHEKATIVVDDWATFKAPARIGVLVREMRAVLASLLDKKIQDARYDVTTGAEKRLVDALHQLLATDGF